ncbi:MAG: hypothetical protein ACI9JE_001532 [Candidatus Krumholzibacteriia bacterium]|jgi:hypothetical protein
MRVSSLKERGPWALLPLIAVLLGGADLAQANWKPVAPQNNPNRVRIIVVSGTESEVTERGIWTLLEPGEELRFTLSGSGSIRLETRPEFRQENAEDEYRLMVSLPDTVRYLKRRAPWEYSVRYEMARGTERATAQTVFGLGEVDQIELDWAAESGALAVTNRANNNRRILCRLLLSDDVRGQANRAEAESPASQQSFGFEANVPQVGWDSNALQAAKDTPDSEVAAEWFLPVDVGARFTKDLNTRTSVQAKYTFYGAFYDDPVLDERRHRLHLGGETHLGSQRNRQGADLFYGYRFTDKNDTYNGRGDRDEFETTDPITNEPIPLGNRFDYREHRLTLGIDKRLGRRTRSTLSVVGSKKDYKQDFSAYADVYALDQDRLEFKFDFEFVPRSNVKLSARAHYVIKDYAEKFSRDINGNEITETPSTLHNSALTLGADLGRGDGWRAHTELKLFSSDDQYAGYWDYSGYAVKAGCGWRGPTGHRIDGRVRYSSKDYDNSHVDHDAALPLRTKSVLVFILKAKYTLSNNWSGVAQWRYKDADNNNASFAYTRAEIVFGFAYER